jgi:hypothetical protein
MPLRSIRSTRSAVLFAALLIGAATFPSSLAAQQGVIDDRASRAAQASTVPTPIEVTATEPASVAGPRIAPVGVTRPVAANEPGPARPVYDNRMAAGSNVAMMGAGAGAVVLGLLIGGEGGTMIAVGGGVIGLVGLYRYIH